MQHLTFFTSYQFENLLQAHNSRNVGNPVATMSKTLILVPVKVHLDWIIQSLLLADRDQIVLPRLSIDGSQLGRAEITVDFMNFFAIFQLKQLYFKHIFLLKVK